GRPGCGSELVAPSPRPSPPRWGVLGLGGRVRGRGGENIGRRTLNTGRRTSNVRHRTLNVGRSALSVGCSMFAPGCGSGLVSPSPRPSPPRWGVLGLAGRVRGRGGENIGRRT